MSLAHASSNLKSRRVNLAAVAKSLAAAAAVANALAVAAVTNALAVAAALANALAAAAALANALAAAAANPPAPRPPKPPVPRPPKPPVPRARLPRLRLLPPLWPSHSHKPVKRATPQATKGQQIRPAMLTASRCARHCARRMRTAGVSLISPVTGASITAQHAQVSSLRGRRPQSHSNRRNLVFWVLLLLASANNAAALGR